MENLLQIGTHAHPDHWPPHPTERRELFVGEAFQFRFPNAPAAVTFTIERAPSGSTATFTGNTFTPDRAGLYVITLACGSTKRRVKGIAFAAAALTDVRLAKKSTHERTTDTERRAVLRNIVLDRFTDAQLASSLESGEMIPQAACNLGFGGYGL